MKIFEEIFYCDIPLLENHPETKLKCYAYKYNDNTLGVNGYYEFSVDEDEYQDYHSKCQIKTKDDENIWVSNIFCAFANQIEQQYYIAVDICDEQGYWDFNCFPKFVLSYIYNAYDDL
jgi:hypothetical protein